MSQRYNSQGSLNNRATLVAIAGYERKQTLTSMIAGMGVQADRIAFKWATKMAEVAVKLAPSSAASRAAGRDSNNPHGFQLKDTIKVIKLPVKNAARYAVDVDAPWAQFVVAGTKKHPIVANAMGMERQSRRTLTRSMEVDRAAGRIFHLTEETQYPKKVINKKTGKVSYTMTDHTHSAKVQRKRELARQRYSQLQALTARLEQEHHDQQMRMITGQLRLVFPWKHARATKANKGRAGLFIGYRVNHPGSKGNTFLLKARQSISLGFYADLKKLVEGRYH